jgi:hypothetical protein
MPEAKQYSVEIKQEADRLLDETNLHTLLQQFGEVILGGSYSYDLMVDPDLDFGLAVEAISPEVRAKVAETFAGQPWAHKVKLADTTNFESQTETGMPKGLYMGLCIPFSGRYWNIDVWFMVAEHVGKDPLAKRMEEATEEQKAVMLQIKYDLIKSVQNLGRSIQSSLR